MYIVAQTSCFIEHYTLQNLTTITHTLHTHAQVLPTNAQGFRNLTKQLLQALANNNLYTFCQTRAQVFANSVQRI